MFKLNKFSKKNNIVFKKSIINPPKRTFMQGNNPMLMMRPITKAIVITNTVIFACSFFMSERNYAREFLYHKMALAHHKYQTLITAHFAKVNTFDFLIDTLITGMIGNSVEMMIGSELMKRLVFGSIAIGSLLMITMHKDDYFFKSESVFRGLVYYLVLQNPNYYFYLFPLPFRVQAKWIGLFLAGMDLLSARYANFGGAIAAGLLLRGKI